MGQSKHGKNVSNANGDHPRRRRRTREERGLPSDEALWELATTYVEVQHRLWPTLRKSGILPKIATAAIEKMVASFKAQFLSEESSFKLPVEFDFDQLAASYSRYSDSNSNPRSLSQQLKLQLERAHQNAHFIPWELVFADAAVTGTTAKRRGYEMAKAALTAVGSSIKVLYIDELGRASRDAIESLTLGRLLEDAQGRLIGASDGFDSDSPMSKMQLSMFAMVHEWFVDQLRSKVNRGMDDAFDRGANTGLPAPGYELVPLLDQNGSPVLGRDSQPVRTEAIEPESAKVLLRIFKMFAEKRRSPEVIGRFLNRIGFWNSRSWDGSRVRKILRRWQYAGIKTYRMTRQVRNRTTGKVKVVKRPRKEWRVRRARHLQIIPYPLWKKTKQLLAVGSAAWSKNRGPRTSRTEVYPTTLVRPICGCCGTPMSLGRSGTYASFTCLNALHGKHGCTFKGYKAVGILERTITAAIENQIFTSDVLDRLTVQSNHFLQQHSNKPMIDTSKIKGRIKEICNRRDHLYRLGEQGQSLKGLGSRIEKLESRLERLRAKLRGMEQTNTPAPGPITRSEVEANVGQLRELLAQDVAAAAPLLRQLTGPIRIEQVSEKGKKKPTWIANFTVNLVPVLANLEAGKGHPTTSTWEFLNTCRWTMSIPMTVRAEELPPYERLSDAVSQMHKKGASVSLIAAKLKVTRKLVDSSLNLASTGKRPKWPKKSKKNGGKTPPTVYKTIAPKVVRLRDVEKRSFAKIAAAIGVSEATVKRAYDYGHPDVVELAIETGTQARRGQYNHLGEAKFRQIRKLLSSGKKTVKEIASKVGCSDATVYLEAKRMGLNRKA